MTESQEEASVTRERLEQAERKAQELALHALSVQEQMEQRQKQRDVDWEAKIGAARDRLVSQSACWRGWLGFAQQARAVLLASIRTIRGSSSTVISRLHTTYWCHPTARAPHTGLVQLIPPNITHKLH